MARSPEPAHPPLPITAWSVACALGRDRQAIASRLARSESGLGPCPAELDLNFETMTGAVEALEALPARWQLYDCRQARIALAIYEGIASALQKSIRRWGKDRVAMVLATSTGGIYATERALETFRSTQTLPESYRVELQHNFYAHCRLLREIAEIGGPDYVVSTACSSSTKVFASAARLIRAGVVDAVLVGGIDSLCWTTLYGFNSLQILSPERCRPFSAERKGLSIGEGGALLLVEREGDAAIELLGTGESSDAHHMSSPHPEGTGAYLAMTRALAAAGRKPEDVDFINAHGTGTLHNDRSESLAISRLFGNRVPVASTKGYTGHMLGAAGATEAALSCLALEEGWMPASLGADPVDPTLGIRVNLERSDAKLATVLSNSFGFGGSNASALFGRVS